MKTITTLSAALAALAVLALSGAPALAQHVPGATPPERALPAAFGAVRAAWSIPEADALKVLDARSMTLEEFTVLAMVAHDAHRAVADVAAMRRAAPSWHLVVAKLGGDLAGLLAHGSGRYHLDPMAAPSEVGPDTVADATLLRLAQVRTLERITGNGPEAILKELDSGRDFAALLPVRSGGPPRGEEPRRSDRPRGGERDRPGWPTGLEGTGATPPQSSGVVETQGQPPPSERPDAGR